MNLKFQISPKTWHFVLLGWNWQFLVENWSNLGWNWPFLVEIGSNVDWNWPFLDYNWHFWSNLGWNWQFWSKLGWNRPFLVEIDHFWLKIGQIWVEIDDSKVCFDHQRLQIPVIIIYCLLNLLHSCINFLFVCFKLLLRWWGLGRRGLLAGRLSAASWCRWWRLRGCDAVRRRRSSASLFMGRPLMQTTSTRNTRKCTNRIMLFSYYDCGFSNEWTST